MAPSYQQSAEMSALLGRAGDWNWSVQSGPSMRHSRGDGGSIILNGSIAGSRDSPTSGSTVRVRQRCGSSRGDGPLTSKPATSASTRLAQARLTPIF